MNRYVALLRAVNVGGTGKLAMADLKRMGEAAGFGQVSTYIASGNLLFTSPDSESAVRAAIAERLAAFAGKPVGVHVRTAQELADVLVRNPFPDAAPNRTVAILLDGPVSADALDHVKGRAQEEIFIGLREIFVHYGDGMADSKLRIPAAEAGTARNMNTIAKLAALAGAL